MRASNTLRSVCIVLFVAACGPSTMTSSHPGTGGGAAGGGAGGGTGTGSGTGTGGATGTGGGASCTPNCAAKQCGDDGCGGTCGDCPGTQTCAASQCCQPQCTGMVCGDDGCGGTCGTCSTGTCTNGQCSTSSACPSARQCGAACCSSGQTCTNSVCAYPPGAVSVTSSGNKLPPTWSVTDATVLKSDDSGTGASAHVNELVTLAVATTSSTTPCPLPHTSSTGKVYCDGFNAKDTSGHAVIVDTFGFLGTKPGCTLPPTDGTAYTAITGVWVDNYDATAKTDTFVVAPTRCGDLGSSGTSTGSTPTASTDIATLLASFPDGQQVSNIHGVVIAAWSSTTSFGFTMEDPQGGPASGLTVSKGKTSTSTAVVPKVGDYVSVSGTAKKEGPVSRSIRL